MCTHKQHAQVGSQGGVSLRDTTDTVLSGHELVAYSWGPGICEARSMCISMALFGRASHMYPPEKGRAEGGRSKGDGGA